MKEIASEVEIARQRILLKQMEIFERNLDRILQIGKAGGNRSEVKEIIQNQQDDLIKINQTKGDTTNEEETYQESNTH